MNAPYCHSRYASRRRLTSEVPIGNIAIGGAQPIRVQSMTTTPTEDVDATVKQVLELAEAGCEIVRITAPSNAAARALKDIAQKVRAAKVDVPLVADIHFLPSAAMEAIEHVEKVRVNPGNYADKKRFKSHDYTESEYREELERLHESFSPLVLRAKELGRCLRIGTNHGSLSDRIMNRYGDSPMGMVESALEFVRICESHGFKNLVLSLKASNPKVMIAAYRLAAAKMAEENMAYPLHLGVTEAGDGEDARVKSSIGIGSLLYDGLGDTIRVSLTEDPVYEVPVARELAQKAMGLWAQAQAKAPEHDALNPFDYVRRLTHEVPASGAVRAGAAHPPRVWVRAQAASNLLDAQKQLKDCAIEGVIVSENEAWPSALPEGVQYLVKEAPAESNPEALPAFPAGKCGIVCLGRTGLSAENVRVWLEAAQKRGLFLALDTDSHFVKSAASVLKDHAARLIFTSTKAESGTHPLGAYRKLANALKEQTIPSPLWIRATAENSMNYEASFSSMLMESAMLAGSLFCDGLGDMLSVETERDPARAVALAYTLLQGSRMRVSRTEYVACPSCGRTLFNLQQTTQRIRARTGHLKGVTIAVMGCIVNGPGEMADADFGYVGGAPAKVNLYVRKDCIKRNIPEDEAVDRLIDLIKEHGKWVEPPVHA